MCNLQRKHKAATFHLIKRLLHGAAAAVDRLTYSQWLYKCNDVAPAPAAAAAALEEYKEKEHSSAKLMHHVPKS